METSVNDEKRPDPFWFLPASVEAIWNQIITNAQNYPYAEQEGFNNIFQNWPNSKYQLPGDRPFNNSNTFVRTMVRDAGLSMYELSGSHPGADSPSAISNEYGHMDPWPDTDPTPPHP